MAQQYDIFISYRRVGGSDFARQMQLALKAKGYKVFLDFDDLKDGVFDRRIEAAIKNSKIFLFILSPHALDRCKNEDDWVRREIECAFVSQCHIVPVNPNALFQGFDDIDGLPYLIKNGLGQHQISTVMMNDLFECTFNNFVQNRIAGIVAPRGQAASSDAASGVEVHIETDIACRVMRFNEELITARPNTDNILYLKKGSHKLKFVSLENENDCYSLVYTVKDDCEILQVNLAKVRDPRLAKEEAALKHSDEKIVILHSEETERQAMAEAERKRIAEDDAKYHVVRGGRKSNKYGFKKGRVDVIPLKYNYAENFSDGLAAVRLGEYSGFIDKTDKFIIPAKYDDARSFSDGLAAVRLGKYYGFIDKTDKFIIPAKYKFVNSFKDGLAAVQSNGKWGFIDRTGKEVIPEIYSKVRDFSDGLAAVIEEYSSGWKFIDKTGKVVIATRYDEVRDFSDGLAAVSHWFSKWGAIDKTGKVVIPEKYDLVYICNGVARVDLNGKQGFFDKTGKELTPIKYDLVSTFYDGMARVGLKDKFGFIDRTGKEVIPLRYDYVCDFEDGFAGVELNGKWGKIDKQGNFTPEE